MTEYHGPNAYRVVDQHPAVQIEFSGAELEVLMAILPSAAHMSRDVVFEQELRDIISRIHMAHDAIRVKFVTTKGQRKRYDS